MTISPREDALLAVSLIDFRGCPKYLDIFAVHLTKKLQFEARKFSTLVGSRSDFQSPVEPSLGQLAPPNAKIISSAASFTKPCYVSKVATLFDKEFSFQRFLRKPPNSSSLVIQLRSNGDAFISFGKTLPVEPIKVCIPKEFAYLITSFGPNSSNALSIKLPL